MALRGLVEGECGAANPLVQWTSHFSQEKSMLGVRILRVYKLSSDLLNDWFLLNFFNLEWLGD